MTNIPNNQRSVTITKFFWNIPLLLSSSRQLTVNSSNLTVKIATHFFQRADINIYCVAIKITVVHSKDVELDDRILFCSWFLDI